MQAEKMYYVNSIYLYLQKVLAQHKGTGIEKCGVC